MDLRIHGASVLLPGHEDLVPADVWVKDGVVAAISRSDADLQAREILEAKGLWVLPGAIDAHVHLGQDLSRPMTADDVGCETGSAASGGVTTTLVYLLMADPYEDVFEATRDLMGTHSLTDFGFHFCLVTKQHLDSMERYVREFGVSSFKLFMNFRGDEGQYLGLPGNDDAFLFDALCRAGELDAVIAVHAENIELIWRLREGAVRDDEAGLRQWNESRPDYVEAEAENRAAYLARVAGASMYAVHVSSRAALEALLMQRAAYPKISIETCPHYLTLDMDSDVGSRGKVNPPLRSAADRDSLWSAVRNGDVDVVASDHVPRVVHNKDRPIWEASAGFPGTGTLLPMMIGEGHLARGISLARIAELTAEKPSKAFGLWPRKGQIAVGSDADIVIINPAKSQTITANTQFSAAGYSLWEGWECPISVEATVLRGQVTYQNGSLGQPTGTFLRR